MSDGTVGHAWPISLMKLDGSAIGSTRRPTVYYYRIAWSCFVRDAQVRSDKIYMRATAGIVLIRIPARRIPVHRCRYRARWCYSTQQAAQAAKEE